MDGTEYIKRIRIADFDYPLPQERIALHPVAERESCRLLVHDADGHILHRRFSDLPELLPPGGLLVCNNTRVINARLHFHKPTGAAIEIFLLEPDSPAEYVKMFESEGPVVWKCLVGNSKKWKEGELSMPLRCGDTDLTLHAVREGEGKVRLSWDAPLPFASVIETAGRIPIPPYLNRESEKSDEEDYQTVYSRVSGSVAAPTAGLHFTPGLIERLRERGTETAEVSLHVGAGTFKPVKSEFIGDHPMHTEHFTVTRSFMRTLLDAYRRRRNITAVGTTSVRTIESLPYIGMHLAAGEPPAVSQWEAYSHRYIKLTPYSAMEEIVKEMDRRGTDFLDCETSIMIAPGFQWRITDTLITNFHQPQSTLLLLVSSFLERGESMSWKSIYHEALKEDYRFLSYGDACLLFPNIIFPNIIADGSVPES